MPRNTAFHSPPHEPFRSQSFLELQPDHITGPVSFLNPTHAIFKNSSPIQKGLSHVDNNMVDKYHEWEDEQSVSNIDFKWRSRDNRKGRHTLVVDPSPEPSANFLAPESTATLREVGRGIVRMARHYPYWDISWLVATIFTLGSVVWIINAFFAYLPLAQPRTLFSNEVLVGGGVSAFVGATIFEIGSVLLMMEAVNENKAGCFGMYTLEHRKFQQLPARNSMPSSHILPLYSSKEVLTLKCFLGWALEKAFSDDRGGNGKIRIRPDEDNCVHHHTNKGNFIGKGYGMVE